MTKTKEALQRIQKQAEAAMAAQGMPPEMLQALPPEQLAAMQQEQQVPPQEVTQEQPSIEQLIVIKLQAAFCAEMNSWYQYIWAIVNAHGPARRAFIQECEEHAKHELEHAMTIAAEIKKITGVVEFGLIPFDLAQLFQGNPCPAVEEAEGNVMTPILTQQIIEAEECAVQLYEELSQITADAYPDVQDAINGILATERDHVVDMTEILTTIGVFDGGSEETAGQPQA